MLLPGLAVPLFGEENIASLGIFDHVDVGDRKFIKFYSRTFILEFYGFSGYLLHFGLYRGAVAKQYYIVFGPSVPQLGRDGDIGK